MSSATTIPVIAIDGPSASGKGTIAERVAERLAFHYLDSGALYRVVAWNMLDTGLRNDDEIALGRLAASLNVRFEQGQVFMNQLVVTDAIRSEAVSAAASRVAALPAVRQALLARQRAFRLPPGLVADGRDMGTVVFPDAALKIYLTATAGERAQRRYKQLIGKGMDANMTALLQDIQARDQRDSVRATAPLRKSDDALALDTTGLAIEVVAEQVLALWAETKRLR